MVEGNDCWNFGLSKYLITAFAPAGFLAFFNTPTYSVWAKQPSRMLDVWLCPLERISSAGEVA